MSIANISDISKLQQQVSNYRVFNSEVKRCITSADETLFLMLEEIIRIKNILDHRLTDADDNLKGCLIALKSCESRIEYDSEENRATPNCSSEKRNWEDARREKQAAQNCVDSMERYIRTLKEYEKKYNDAKSKFINLIDNTNLQAISELERRDQIAQEYINIRFDE